MNISISAKFIDKIIEPMIIILPSLILITTSCTLVLLMLFKPFFRFHWLIASIGAFLSVVAVIIWQTKLPYSFSLPAWELQTLFNSSLSWQADSFSWQYALSLTSLGLATITTSVVRKLSTPLNWASILFLISIGLFTVCADNPLTLVISWLALDITEMVTLLRSVKEEKSEELIIAFCIRLSGVFLLLWASIISISSGSPLSFREISEKTGIFLLLAAFLRLGVFPLHFPIIDFDLRRGIITTIRLVSAASGLSLLARIPSNAFPSHVLPVLIIFIGSFSIISGWNWIISTDELVGRPFLISGLGFLAITATLDGNSRGSAAWGVSLILSGGLLFLNSSRGKRTYWILILGLWGISGLPFSLTSNGWINQTNYNYLLLIPIIIGHSFILAGFFRHAFKRRSDIDIGLELRWVQLIYPIGLSILPIIGIVISLWDWFQTRSIGLWWMSTITLILSISIYLLFDKQIHFSKVNKVQFKSVKTNILAEIFWTIYHSVRKIIKQLTSILEGDGGMLWSIVLLVLFISIISQVLRFSP